jgi:hypothetical protein
MYRRMMMAEQVKLPKMHFSKRIRQQYNNIPFAIAREAVQNSYDAGASEVIFWLSDNQFYVTDDGCGMTLPKARENWLTLGGSEKQEGSVGTFGAAKELLSFAWKDWWVKGQGYKAEGEGVIFEVDKTDGKLEGFAVGATDDGLRADLIDNELRAFAGLSNIDTEIKVSWGNKSTDIETLEQGRTLRSNQLVQSWDFGDLYVHKSAPRTYEEPGYLYVRTRGLFTCREHVGGDKVWYLLLDEASDKVLTENRDSLRWRIRERVKKEVRALIDSGSSDKRSSATITIHRRNAGIGGGTLDSETFDGERGTFNVDGVVSNLWRKAWVVASEQGSVRVKTRSGNPRPTFTKSLEVLNKAANMVADVVGLERPIVGLYFPPEDDPEGTVNAIHSTINGRHVIAVRQGILLEDSAYGVIDCVIHEMAHYGVSSHSQAFERERRTLARDAGSVMSALIHSVKKEQDKPRQNGRYWEEA